MFLQDLIILRGKNVHPEDLEDRVRGCHPSIRPGGVAAFSVDSSRAGQGEEVVLYLEVTKGKISQSALKEICSAARQTVSVG